MPSCTCGTGGHSDGWACKPNSVEDGHSSRRIVTHSLQRPTRRCSEPSRFAPGQSLVPSLFGLAPCGVCPAAAITGSAVRFYRTFSPLPCVSARRYLLCGTFRRTALTLPSRTLSGTLLCGVRTFLPHCCSVWETQGKQRRRRPSGPPTNPFIIVDFCSPITDRPSDCESSVPMSPSPETSCPQDS